MWRVYRRIMLPPLSTRMLRTAIESKRREDAALRWSRALNPVRSTSGPARRDIPRARPHGR